MPIVCAALSDKMRLHSWCSVAVTAPYLRCRNVPNACIILIIIIRRWFEALWNQSLWIESRVRASRWRGWLQRLWQWEWRRGWQWRWAWVAEGANESFWVECCTVGVSRLTFFNAELSGLGWLQDVHYFKIRTSIQTLSAGDLWLCKSILNGRTTHHGIQPLISHLLPQVFDHPEKISPSANSLIQSIFSAKWKNSL